MEINGIPVYDFVIDDEITDEGVTVMSLVDDPAVEKTFIKLSLQNQPAGDENKLIILEHNRPKLSVNNEKRIITGVALRADFPIYRNDYGKEYYMRLSKQEILKIAQKFMKEQRLKSVNLNHRYNTKDIYLFESFITGDKHKLEYDEFKDVEEGSWMVSYKVDNEEVWNSIKKGDFKGFSVEMSGELMRKYNNEELCKHLINNSKIMAKSKLRLKFEAFLKGIIKLGSVITEENIELFFDGEELTDGTQVYVQDEEGVLVIAPDGDYSYDNKVYHVVNGIVEGIMSSTENKEEKAETDVSDVPDAETGDTVSVEKFNELIEIVKDVVDEVNNIEDKIEFIEEFKKQKEELQKRVDSLSQKLEKALKNNGETIKQKPVPAQEKRSKDYEFNSAIMQ